MCDEIRTQELLNTMQEC